MKSLVILAAAGLAASAAIAQAPPALRQVARTGDANEIVCRVFRNTRSRLSATRICLTRSEWLLRKLEQRRGAELLQMRRHSATF